MVGPPKILQRLVCAVVVVSMFGAVLGESAHTVFFDHEVCVEHGDLIHNHGEDSSHHGHEHDHHGHEHAHPGHDHQGHEHAHPGDEYVNHTHEHHVSQDRATRSDDEETGALPTATESAGHDHCTLCFWIRDEQSLNTSSATVNFVTLAKQGWLLVFTEKPSAPQIALLRRAPKLAPPAFEI